MNARPSSINLTPPAQRVATLQAEPFAGSDTAFDSPVEEAQLKRLAALGAHSAGLAHELKNAFVPVKTMVQILREQHPKDELCDLVNRELVRIDSLLTQMLRLAAPSPTRHELLSVHEVLAYSLRLLQPQLIAKRITIKTAWDATPDQVNGNEHQVQQVIMNLCLNALEAMQPGGTLGISTQPSSTSALAIQIRDTGCGMSGEMLSRLFTPFFTTKTDGTGLGLHITRRIIEDHQGSISAESIPGKGTVFTILLPLAELPVSGN
jgi:signal transduction histidine kinase